jgi:hypothetical protein
MSVRNVTLTLFVRDAVEAGAWYERVLNVRTSDIQEYGDGCRYVEIQFGIFNLQFDERPSFDEQNVPLRNQFMEIELNVSRTIMDRLDKLSLPLESDRISDARDVRWVTLRDPNVNELRFVCYSDFTQPKRPPPVLRAER